MEGDKLTGLVSTQNSLDVAAKVLALISTKGISVFTSFQLLQMTISPKIELIERIIAQINRNTPNYGI